MDGCGCGVGRGEKGFECYGRISNSLGMGFGLEFLKGFIINR